MNSDVESEYKDEIIDISDVETGMQGEDIIEPLGGDVTGIIIKMIGDTAVSAENASVDMLYIHRCEVCSIY